MIVEGGLSPSARELRERIQSRNAVVAVVGLGYVGLPLARAAHHAGFSVLGYDADRSKIEMLDRGETYIKHLGDDLARTLAASRRFSATSDGDDLEQADAILLCVPTPLSAHREPDLSFILSSTQMVARTLSPGQLIVLTSTTFPGTTRDRVLPILEERGLICGTDFFLAYSPEREDPGRKDADTSAIPKLVGGVDEISRDLAYELYRQIVSEVHQVESAEVAEAAKLVENIYRAVNIALVNELKVLFTELGIDVWQVIEAASTKPFGFKPFYPGPGLGGHCIPIDPFYLTWKAKEVGLSTRFIELAGEVNTRMPAYVVSRVAMALNDRGKPVKGSKILVCGVAYKPNVDDARETPAAEIIELLGKAGAVVSYHDPHIPIFPAMRKHHIELVSETLTTEVLRTSDCVLIVTDHAVIDWELIGREAKLVVDTRNVMRRFGERQGAAIKAKIVSA